MHTLVGDARYDQEEEFARALVFDWRLHPCSLVAGVSRRLCRALRPMAPDLRTASCTAEKAEASRMPASAPGPVRLAARRRPEQGPHPVALLDQGSRLPEPDHLSA
jgi:hypothetical protein